MLVIKYFRVTINWSKFILEECSVNHFRRIFLISITCLEGLVRHIIIYHYIACFILATFADIIVAKFRDYIAFLA